MFTTNLYLKPLENPLELIKKTFIILLVSVTLLSCGTHIISMRQINPVTIDEEYIPATMNKENDQVTLIINGIIYNGRWVFVPSKSSGNVDTDFKQKAFSFSLFSAAGTAACFLKGSDDSIMKCEFYYSPVTRSGIGTCKECKENGITYDVLID